MKGNNGNKENENENVKNLSTEDCLNVLVDDGWRPLNIEFYSFDVWDFSKTNKL